MKKETRESITAAEAEYTGTLRIPGTKEDGAVTLIVGLENKSVRLNLSGPEFKDMDFQIGFVTVRNLLKYDELHFITSDLPIKDVDLQWKTNIARADNSVAGVIIARPNKHKVVGEVGFSLVQVK